MRQLNPSRWPLLLCNQGLQRSSLYWPIRSTTSGPSARIAAAALTEGSSVPTEATCYSCIPTRQPRLLPAAAACSSAASSRMALMAPAAPLARLGLSCGTASATPMWLHRSLRAVHVRTAALKGSGKAKTIYRCSKCGKEYFQSLGKCTNCDSWGTVQQCTITPPPPSSAVGGASAAASLLHGSSSSSSSNTSGNGRTKPPGSGSNPLQQQQYTPAVYSSSDEISQYTPGSDFPEELYQQYQQEEQQQQQYAGTSSAYRSGWIQPDDAAVAGPVRLDDITPSDAELRLPLAGPTGQEVATVLGGGVVPGSLVLVGGEPGTGKSTLLLQVAGLVAHACSNSSSGSSTSMQQQQRSPGGDIADDLPLSARLAAAGGSRTNLHWLDEVTSTAAAAAVDGAGVMPVVREGLRGRPVVYFTAEESKYQVWERAKRLGLVSRSLDVRLMVENRAERIGAAMAELQPAAVIVDSIQTVALADVPSRPGSVTQVRECATFLLHVAKNLGCATFLVGHVTKDGSIAGPKHLEHLVDVVLYLEGVSGAGGARQQGLRMLRAVKNRHGRVGEVGLFKMHNEGLVAVEDTSVFLSEPVEENISSDDEDGSGSTRVGTAICVVQEGVRPLPLEIQALASSRIQTDTEDDTESESENDVDVTSNTLGSDMSVATDDNTDIGDISADEDETDNSSSTNGSDTFDDRATMTVIASSRRSGSGRGGNDLAPLYRHFVGVTDRPRMAMLLELLTKYTPIKTHLYNLFLNVVSGYRIPPGETSTDLAILAAIASSVLDTPLPTATALLGEVGLAGELRPVHNLELRMLELSKLGFKQVIIPMRGAKEAPLRREDVGGMTVIQKHKLKAALAHLFGDHRLRNLGWRKKDKKDKKDNNGSSNGGGGATSDRNSSSGVQVGASAGSRTAAVGSTNGRRRRSTQQPPQD